MFNNLSIYNLINIYPFHFYNLVRGSYSNKLTFMCSFHDKF